VKSEYGNPGIVIENTQGFKRVDLTKTLPKNGMALIKRNAVLLLVVLQIGFM
jgi:hypothetical protein